MSGPINPDALIHDLAIVLAGSLHPSAKIGPAPLLAARRMRDVLMIADGETVRGIERELRAVLDIPEPLSGSQRFQVSEARDLLATWDLNRGDPDVYNSERVLADQVRNLLAIIGPDADR